MGKINDIENEIQRLTPDELAAFREWFLEFDAQVWDRQIAADVKAGKLKSMADVALSSHRKGESSEI
jgi:hypothetical protein